MTLHYILKSRSVSSSSSSSFLEIAMAVQAQHLSNSLPRDFGARSSNLVNVLDDVPLLAGAVYSDPQSELTCNLSGSRKSSRGQELPVAMNQNLPMQPVRVVDSTGTSTSGRQLLSPLALDLYSHIYQQNLEIDAIIRLQNERLRLGIEESRKRHCRGLMAVLENQVVNKLREKEMELEMANRKNAELEEKIRQISAENQIWFNVAKNNEAVVSSLKASIEQVLLQNSVHVNAVVPVDVKEGYGDSELVQGDDARSCCFESDDAVREVTAAANPTAVGSRVCRVCRRNDVSVLLLPCRHLCICKDCESKVETCPICNGNKNACLLIFLS